MHFLEEKSPDQSSRSFPPSIFMVERVGWKQINGLCESSYSLSQVRLKLIKTSFLRGSFLSVVCGYSACPFEIPNGPKKAG